MRTHGRFAGQVRLAAQGKSARTASWWQIVPRQLGALLGSEDRAAAKRAMDAMLKMEKLDLAALQRAHVGA